MESTSSISYEQGALITAFAQQDMVRTFVSGVDPNYDLLLSSYLDKLFREYPRILVDSISQVAQIEKSQKQLLLDVLFQHGNEMLDQFQQSLEEYKQKTHIQKLLAAVGVLPKDKLAELAESLINLTSLKRQVLADEETVGGPIDVAIISKGDGFIWIKRKHYFDPALNPGFFSNYYRKCELKEQKGGEI